MSADRRLRSAAGRGRTASWWVLLAVVPFLAGATCTFGESGGFLDEITLEPEGPLYFDPQDGRFSDSPPDLEVVLIRESDGAEALTTLAMKGDLANGFEFVVQTPALLDLPPAPCDDTRHMQVRLRLVRPDDWSATLASELGDVSSDLLLLPDSEAIVDTWASWTLTLQPEIQVPSETVISDDLPLGC